MKSETQLQTVIQFLEEINIPVIEEELDDSTFLPGLTLRGQSIVMDPKKLKYPGDLLHEAGHIAVTEEKFRPLIGSKEMDPEWPTLGDEIVAILWSFAALNHLKLDPRFVFHPDGYKGSSDWFMERFTSGDYMGLPLLEWMGLCNAEEFPKMKRWIR